MAASGVSRYPRPSPAHECDASCVCPDHPALPLLHAALLAEHACQLESCRYGHGLEGDSNFALWRLKHMIGTGPEPGPVEETRK